MVGTFGVRTRLLEEMVGVGELRSEIVVDQIYAHHQHEDYFAKRHGGTVKYLEGPLFGQLPVNMEILAKSVLLGLLKEAMIEVTDRVTNAAIELTPELPEAVILKHSYQRMVKDNGALIYNLGPLLPRFTQKEITAIHEAVGPAAKFD